MRARRLHHFCTKNVTFQWQRSDGVRSELIRVNCLLTMLLRFSSALQFSVLISLRFSVSPRAPLFFFYVFSLCSFRSAEQN